MMMPSASDYYEKRAKEGYGLQYPDGHVIRLYEHFLKDNLPNSGRGQRFFDFGCWNGTHSEYFADKGFIVSGADIISGPVDIASRRVNGNFSVIDDSSNLLEKFDGGFDVIFANQVLYFLDDVTLSKRLSEFRAMLRPGGYLIATMISRKCFYSDQVTDILPNGLEKISFTQPERLKGKTALCRFMNSHEHMVEIFGNFTPVQIGRYECDIDMEHSTEHFIFIGS